MHQAFKTLTLVAVAGAPSFCVASPIDRSLIPPDAGLVVHVDVDAARSSALGKYLLANKSQFNLQGLDGLKAFGVDAERDFAAVTVVASTAKPDKGAVIIKCAPTVDALWNHLKTEPHAKPMSVAGHDILSWDDNGTRKYGVVKQVSGATNPTQQRQVFMCDDWEYLATVLTFAASSTAPPSAAAPDGATTASPPETASDGSIVFISLRSIPADMKKSGDLGAQALFGSVKSLTIDISDAAGSVQGKAVATLDSDAAASDMQEVITGGGAFARLAARKMPELQPIAQALSSSKPVVDRARLTLSAQWTTPEAQRLLSFITSGKNDAGKNPSK